MRAVDNCATPPGPKRKRVLKKVLSPDLSAALDRTKVSDRKATFVIAEAAKSLGHNISEFTLSRSSIRRKRQEHREERLIMLKEVFIKHAPLVVHWDGKLLPDLTKVEKVDRLPVL